jgi:hypothetical protein
MTDPEVLQTATAVTGLTFRRFAADVLNINWRTMEAWLAGDRPMAVGLRGVCLAIIDRPEIAEAIIRDRETARRTQQR